MNQSKLQAKSTTHPNVTKVKVEVIQAYLDRLSERSGWRRQDSGRLRVEAMVQDACWRHEERCEVRTVTESGYPGLPDC